MAILVAVGNPTCVRGLADLGRSDVRVAMPNPVTEGVGELIAAALERAGGTALRITVMERKIAAGSTRLTRIHHRESPLWLAAGEVDACPLWSTEARYHRELGAAVEVVEFPTSTTWSASMGWPSCEAAEAFVTFLRGPGSEIYRRYGFAVADAGHRAGR